MTFDQLPAADTTADLNLGVRCIEYRLNFVGVVSSSRNSVKVDNVEVTKPILSPGVRYAHGIRDAEQLAIV